MIVEWGGDSLLLIHNIIVTDVHLAHRWKHQPLRMGSIISNTSAAKWPAMRILSISSGVLRVIVIFITF